MQPQLWSFPEELAAEARKYVQVTCMNISRIGLWLCYPSANYAREHLGVTKDVIWGGGIVDRLMLIQDYRPLVPTTGKHRTYLPG